MKNLKIKASFGLLLLHLFCLQACTPSEKQAGETVGYIQTADLPSLQKFLSYESPRTPLISAHRGGPAKGFPENCLETFENSTLFGPTIIECDISLSKDGQMVMMHDDKLDRTSNGTGNVRDFTLEELKLLRLEDDFGQLTGFQMPTLKETIVWGKGKSVLMLDVKRDVPYKMVIDEVKANNALGYCAIITYSLEGAIAVRKNDTDIMICFSAKQKSDVQRALEAGIPANKLVVFTGISEQSKELYEYVHEIGALNIIGTLGNLDNKAAKGGDKLYGQLFEKGCDIFATNRPVEARIALASYWDPAQSPKSVFLSNEIPATK